MCVPHLATILCRPYPLPIAPCPLPLAPCLSLSSPPLLLVVYLQLLYVSECGLEHRLATLYAAIGIIAGAV